MAKPILIDFNPIELKCYPFMISLNEFNGSSNFFSSKKNKKHKC